ncbi:MAG: putative DNA transfer protein [Prokaryotic dsDNA virus sp.]|nr:MAG: putative DNA transfer protein [Prokaryotic dsDNA virus sp.]
MMADIEKLKRALIEADRSGDTEAAQLFADRIKRLQLAQPERSIGEQVVGGLETAATIASGALAEPIAGVAGIAQSLNPFADEGAGAEAVKATQEALTYQPRTEVGQESLQATGEALKPVGDFFQDIESGLGDYAYNLTGSPAFAAAATTAPTAFLELLGAGVGRRAVKGAGQGVEAAQDALSQAQDFKEGVPTEETISSGVDIIQQGTPEQVAEFAQADPKFFEALDELGISSEPLAAFASQNPQFRDIQGALRSVPGSVLDPQARAFMEDTAQAADNLIQKYGGTLDKAELSERIKTDSIRAIDDLADEADQLYSSIREQIPPTTRIEADNTLQFLQQKADEFGGVENLPKELKQVYTQLSREGGSTLGLVDQIRKEFGQATRKNSGRFKDAESGLAKAMYSRLSNDVDTFAESQGLEALTKAAKGLVAQRKQLEDNLTGLYGKNLNKALGDTVGAAIKGLEKGRVERFSEVMQSIPAEKRGEAAISYMNDVFKGSGAGQQGLNATQFRKWYENINRSPRAKSELYKNLPKDSRKAIEALYKVSEGISKSQAQTVKTGAINAMFNPDTGFLRRMVGNAGNAALNIAGGMLGGPGGSLASQIAQDATSQFLSQSSDGARAASNLMSSPQFQNLIRQSVKEGVVEGGQASERLRKAEKALERSKAYQKWVNTLSKDQKSALAGGLIPYLLSPVDSEEDTTSNGE